MPTLGRRDRPIAVAVAPIRRLSNHLPFRMTRDENTDETMPDKFMVVGNENSHPSIAPPMLTNW